MPAHGQPLLLRLRRGAVAARTEGGGAARDSVAIGLGVFIGCLPLYGFHLPICVATGTVFRLNRLKTYLAANISNPFVAPWLVFAELQTGAWLRRGSFHSMTVETVTALSLTGVGADLLVGSLAVGVGLGALAGAITYALLRGSSEQDAFATLVRRAADRYVDRGIVAWEFARGKLRADPVYRAVLTGGLLTSADRAVPAGGAATPHTDGTLVDIGCGMGLMMALLAEADRARTTGIWPTAWPAPPQFERIIGIEIRSRVAAIAATALGDDAVVVSGDACAALPDRVDTVLLFDVLHLMRRDEQEELIAALASTLTSTGLILIREADAAAGWRFTAVRWGNRAKAVVFGSRRQQFSFRSASEWSACFAGHGLHATTLRMSAGTPFANVLFVVTPSRSPSRV